MTSLSEELQTVTGTAVCSAATAEYNAGTRSLVGSTCKVELPIETVAVTTVALVQFASEAPGAARSNRLRCRLR